VATGLRTAKVSAQTLSDRFWRKAVVRCEADVSELPRPRKSQLSFNDNLTTQNLIKETALCKVSLCFRSLQRAQTITERPVRATPFRNLIGAAKGNCLQIGAPAGRA
jgi:hypothetical protein